MTKVKCNHYWEIDDRFTENGRGIYKKEKIIKGNKYYCFIEIIRKGITYIPFGLCKNSFGKEYNIDKEYKAALIIISDKESVNKAYRLYSTLYNAKRGCETILNNIRRELNV